MGFQWDPDKARSNLRKHGVAFRQAVKIFQGPVFRRSDARRNYGEPRWLATGALGNDILTVVFTFRDGDVRIISARTARKDERKTYEDFLEEGSH